MAGESSGDGIMAAMIIAGRLDLEGELKDVYERGEVLGRMIREWLTRKLFRRSSWSRFVVWWEKDRKVGGK